MKGNPAANLKSAVASLTSGVRSLTRMEPNRRPGYFGLWGAAPGELDRRMDCDRHMPDFDQQLVRAIEVDAPAAHLYRWLTQLRTAPYSYDWIDNRGRRSPVELTPGLEALEIGQSFMSIFRLVKFEPGSSVTLVHEGTLFGKVAVTYAADPISASRSRLFVRMLVTYRRSPAGAGLSRLLPAGDLVMMRKQLQNLSHLAASTAD